MAHQKNPKADLDWPHEWPTQALREVSESGGTAGVRAAIDAIRHWRTPAALVRAAPSARDIDIVFVNAALCQLSGMTPQELVGRTAKLLTGPLLDPEYVAIFVRAEKEPARITRRKFRADKTPYDVVVRISPALTFQGRTTHYLVEEWVVLQGV